MTWLIAVPLLSPSASPVAVPTSSPDLWWDGYHTGMWIAFLIAAAIVVAFWLGVAVGKGWIRGNRQSGVPAWVSTTGQRNT